MASIQQSLWDYFKECDNFSLSEATTYIKEINEETKEPSIRARIYEGINKGLFERIAKGVYHVVVNENNCLLINGDGRDLSFINDNSIDAIITDHPYSLKKSHLGGNRNLANYECFQYTEKDFLEKHRVLKPGGFLVEMLPSKNGDNWKYLNKIHEIADKVGLEFYAVVPWKKGDFIINQGRNSKNTEDIYFFSKGKARSLRLDAKYNKSKAISMGLPVNNLSSIEVANKLIDKGVEIRYMSGTNGMLPTNFDYNPPSKEARLHQAEKPVSLLEDIIKYVSLPNEIILDQFAGSGNLGKAAIKQNRSAILIEQDTEIYNKMKKSIEKDSYEMY